MTEFDSFSTQLLEESKAFLEKARTTESFIQSAYLHSSLLLAMSALEACINSIVEELLVEPYRDKYSVYEQALLLEKDIKFDRGEYTLGNGLKTSRITDRIEFLYYKYTGKKLSGNYSWYSSLKQSIELRNKLGHPKGHLQLTVNQVEVSVLAVIDTINELYKAIYKKKFPAFDRGIKTKFVIS